MTDAEFIRMRLAEGPRNAERGPARRWALPPIVRRRPAPHNIGGLLRGIADWFDRVPYPLTEPDTRGRLR